MIFKEEDDDGRERVTERSSPSLCIVHQRGRDYARQMIVLD